VGWKSVDYLSHFWWPDAIKFISQNLHLTPSCLKCIFYTQHAPHYTDLQIDFHKFSGGNSPGPRNWEEASPLPISYPMVRVHVHRPTFWELPQPLHEAVPHRACCVEGPEYGASSDRRVSPEDSAASFHSALMSEDSSGYRAPLAATPTCYRTGTTLLASSAVMQHTHSLVVSVFDQRPRGRGFESRWLRAIA